jgi:hypothetical protein
VGFKVPKNSPGKSSAITLNFVKINATGWKCIKNKQTDTQSLFTITWKTIWGTHYMGQDPS